MARPRSDIRKRVVHAARQRFLDEGVDGASLRKIARDAGTSIGMVYYYFPNKDDLFLGVVEEVYEVVLADLMQALDPRLPAKDRIRNLYRRVAAVTDDEVFVIRLVIREALISSTRFDRVLERFQRGHLPLMLSLVGDALSDGTFDPEIPAVVAVSAMLALGGPAQLLRRVIETKAPFSHSIPRADLSDRMVSVLLNGVGKKPSGGES
jgi:AcrR family transcriptional regulator